MVKLPDDDPQAVDMMMRYFYHRDYPHTSLLSPALDGPRSDSPDSGATEPSIKSNPAVTRSSSPTLSEPVEVQEPDTQEEGAPPEAPAMDFWRPTLRSRRRKKNKSGSETDSCTSPKPTTAADAPPPPPPEEPEPGSPVPSQQAEQAEPAEPAELVPPTSQDESNLAIHARVYSLATKYGVQGLGSLAVEKFQSEVVVHWDSSDFLQATEVAYTSTAETVRGLRDIIVRTFFDNPSLMRKDEGTQLVKRVEGLAFDILGYVWEERM